MALTKCKECGLEVSSKAKECPKCGAPMPRRRLVLWTLLALGAMWIVVSSWTNEMTSGPTHSAAVRKPPSPKEIALKNTKLDYQWRKVGFDVVMEADFTVRNNSPHDIRDIKIECVHFAKSGTRIDSNRETIYDVVKSKSTKRFPKVNMGFIHSQAHTSSCRITDLVAG